MVEYASGSVKGLIWSINELSHIETEANQNQMYLPNNMRNRNLEV